MTTTKTTHLIPAGLSKVDGWSTMTWRIEDGVSQGFDLFHSVPDEFSAFLVPEDRGDHVLVATLIRAMQQGSNIHVEGQVSPCLLDGLETLQEIWHRWAPRRYHRVDIRVSTETPLACKHKAKAGLFAFSGGVDASFTFFRHLQEAAGRNNVTPGAALLVHGMDIPLARPDFFNEAAARVRRTLESTRIPLVTMRTNTRNLNMDWEDTFGLQLFACFLALQPHFSHALHGSGEPYDTLVLPWGATPLTDPLCSTENLTIVHDGCAFDRTEKVHWLAEHTQICDQLRVCWEGPNLGRNCGVCEKCVRTMLNFWAMGHKPSTAFPQTIEPHQVAKMNVRNQPQLLELQSILNHAMQVHDSNDSVLKALKTLILRKKLSLAKKRVSSFLSSFTKR